MCCVTRRQLRCKSGRLPAATLLVVSLRRRSCLNGQRLCPFKTSAILRPNLYD